MVFLAGRLMGFDSNEDTCKNDDRDDEAVEERRVYESLATLFHGSKNLFFCTADKRKRSELKLDEPSL